MVNAEAQAKRLTGLRFPLICDVDGCGVKNGIE